MFGKRAGSWDECLVFIEERARPPSPLLLDCLGRWRLLAGRLTLSSAGGAAQPCGRLEEVSQVNPAVARQLKRAAHFYSQLAD